MTGGIIELREKEEAKESLKNLLLGLKFSCLSEKDGESKLRI